ncbi:MAG: sulfotransferase [Deltaproteobacteria bacterium]|nr:sulfotransferase [Deltaproteobacteria bacterium]MBW2412965.1 sulfotransferase [Deltaproteobacteria bacterium]
MSENPSTSPEIRAPIFIIGAPRSGTSILYEKLARHPDLAWISNITKKVPDSLLVTRLIGLFRDDHRPTEAKKIWGRYADLNESKPGRKDATPRATRFLRRVVRNNLKLFHKPRFLSKDCGNSLRMEFLDEIFPDAIFIHIIRDGRAVAHSTLRVRETKDRFWGIRPPGWKDLVDRPAIEASAMQWEWTLEAVRNSAEGLPESRYMEVRYEDFVDDPEGVLRAIGDKCGLEWDAAFLKELVSDVSSQDFKWRERLSPEEVEMLHGLIGKSLADLGYET